MPETRVLVSIQLQVAELFDEFLESVLTVTESDTIEHVQGNSMTSDLKPITNIIVNTEEKSSQLYPS